MHRVHTSAEAAPLAFGSFKGIMAQDFFPDSDRAIFTLRNTGGNEVVDTLTPGSLDDTFPLKFTFHYCRYLVLPQ